jgi:hypothetical protein
MDHNTEGGATLTRPAPIMHIADGTATVQPQHREQHRRGNWLRDVILGGQDGLVNILGIILGVIAGGGSNLVLLAAGFAAATGHDPRAASRRRDAPESRASVSWAEEPCPRICPVDGEHGEEQAGQDRSCE